MSGFYRRDDSPRDQRFQREREQRGPMPPPSRHAAPYRPYAARTPVAGIPPRNPPVVKAAPTISPTKPAEIAQSNQHIHLYKYSLTELQFLEEEKLILEYEKLQQDYDTRAIKSRKLDFDLDVLSLEAFKWDKQASMIDQLLKTLDQQIAVNKA